MEMETKCEHEADWWENALVYQIYPRSFKDSNGDGIGDLKGIESKLDYFTKLEIDVIWMSPIFLSPMADMGYDIANFYEIDPIFGTMADFDSLLKNMTDRNIKLLLDFVPNHTSSQCEWFQKSIQRIDPYTNYYVWKDPKGLDQNKKPIPPNNWISVFEGLAWEFNEQRGQFYLHQFLKEQPDLNYRCPELVEEMKNVVDFWLKKGIHGFRVDAILHLVEDENFPDEPIISDAKVNGIPAYDAFNHKYSKNQPETYEIIAEWRKICDQHKAKDGVSRILITEAFTDVSFLMQYYGTPERPIAHAPMNLLLIGGMIIDGCVVSGGLTFKSPASEFVDFIKVWMDNMPAGNRPNWVLGNHDQRRITTRFAPEMSDGILMLITLLPGIAVHYQGDELGLRDMKIRYEQTKDCSAVDKGEIEYINFSRDPERTPIPWNDGPGAGFSDAQTETWLPINPDYYIRNVKNQMAAEKSNYQVFKDLVKLRKTPTFVSGNLGITAVSEWVLGFSRCVEGSGEIYFIILNLDNHASNVNLVDTCLKGIPTSSLTVIIASVNSEYEKKAVIDIRKPFPMRPNSALVLYGKSS